MVDNVVNFKKKVAADQLSDALIETAEAFRGRARAGVAIMIADDGISIVSGPHEDGAMEALAKLQAILGAVYADSVLGG